MSLSWSTSNVLRKCKHCLQKEKEFFAIIKRDYQLYFFKVNSGMRAFNDYGKKDA
jgi:hypothetical protein